MTKVERVIERIKAIDDRVILAGPLSDFAAYLGANLAEELPPFQDWPTAKGDEFGDDYDSLTSGFEHGVSLASGTHDGIPAGNRTLLQTIRDFLCLKN